MKAYIDLDNTLVNTVDSWIEFINSKENINLTLEDIHTYPWLSMKFKDENGKGIYDHYWESGDEYCIYDGKIKPHTGSQEFIDELKSMFGKENVHIVTMALDGIERFKNKFIKHYFKIDPENIHYYHNKYDVTKKLGSGILLDDYQKHTRSFVTNGSPSILFTNNGKYKWDIDQTKELENKYSELFYVVDNYEQALWRMHCIKNKYNEAG